MFNTLGRKTLNLVILLCLVIAVQGTIIFSLTEAVRFAVFPETLQGSPAGNAVNASAFANWANVEAIQITRTRDASPASFRNGLLRVLLLSGVLLTAAFCMAKSFVKPVNKNNVLITKNDIPMKLLN